MDEVFDLSKFDEYKEDNRREVKAAIISRVIEEGGKEEFLRLLKF